MINTRRAFLAQLSLLTGSAVVDNPLTSIAKGFHRSNILSPDGSLSIYYTNELNGHSGAVHNGFGGLRQVNSILKEAQRNGLVLNAGGFLNGSKNSMAQLDAISLMNRAGYHAAVITNKELMGSHDKFVQLASKISFSLVNCNHEFTGDLNRIVKPYIIVNTGNIKIGITGVSEKLTHIYYKDPVQSANETALYLKKQQGCNLVICLSALECADNLEFVEKSNYIDAVIGQGKNTVTGNIVTYRNQEKHEVMLASSGANGLTIGKIELNFNKAGSRTRTEAKNIVPGAPANERENIAIANLERIKYKISVA